MNIFISWSGERSRRMAEHLESWLQCVLQAVKPWVSTSGIDRGALWYSEISTQLSSASTGIICITAENKNRPWILFEAGALAKGLAENRVCTFLIDLEPNDLEPPLSQFNHTSSEKESIKKLVLSINKSLDSLAIKPEILSRVFETYWPQFEEGFAEIIKTTKNTPKKEERKETDILSELLTTVRSLEKRTRVETDFDPKFRTKPTSSLSFFGGADSTSLKEELYELLFDYCSENNIPLNSMLHYENSFISYVGMKRPSLTMKYNQQTIQKVIKEILVSKYL